MDTSSRSRLTRTALVALFLVAYVREGGAESVTLSTYYPAPSGVYTQLITTGNTYLARDGGSVGIGTTSPEYVLDVPGTASRLNRLLLGSQNSAGIQPADAGVANLHLDAFTGSSGGVYVGWYAGTGGLVVGNGAAVQQAQVGGKGATWFNSGSVGIGLTAPAAGTKLDVAGPIRIAGPEPAANPGAIYYDPAGNVFMVYTTAWLKLMMEP